MRANSWSLTIVKPWHGSEINNETHHLAKKNLPISPDITDLILSGSAICPETSLRRLPRKRMRPQYYLSFPPCQMTELRVLARQSRILRRANHLAWGKWKIILGCRQSRSCASQGSLRTNGQLKILGQWRQAKQVEIKMASMKFFLNSLRPLWNK